MKLLVDVGNTRLKLATLDAHDLTFVRAIAIESAQQLKAALRQTLQAPTGLLDMQFEACTAVSVGSPEINHAVHAALAPMPVSWVTPSSQAAGLINGYPDPSQLGADRWVAMIGLTRHFCQPHPPLVLASFGTATTVDTLGPDNLFRGGLILPGVSLMHNALATGTARLPNATGTLAEFPTSTLSAITSGVVAAQVGAVMRQVELARHAYQQKPIICVTGGALPAIREELNRTLEPSSVRELPHVVLDGLAVLAN